MFKFFKKKKTTTETDELFPTMTAKEILLGINAIKKRSKIDKHHATFLNAYVSKKTCRKLKRKKCNVEILNSDDCPSFKVSW